MTCYCHRHGDMTRPCGGKSKPRMGGLCASCRQLCVRRERWPRTWGDPGSPSVWLPEPAPYRHGYYLRSRRRRRVRRG